jgi:nitroreductase
VTESPASDARERVRPLLRVRQIREFTTQPPTDAELDAIADAARWSGSSTNSQPWRFIVMRDREAIARLAAGGVPQTRTLRTATTAIAIALPHGGHEVSLAYDEGRATERMLIAANLLGLTAGIAWIRKDVADLAADVLGLPADQFVRTIVAVGHPTPAALQPKSEPGKGRLPRDEVVFAERWPGS